MIEKDLHEVNKWLSDHEMSEWTKDDVPSVGFIEDDVACGFLCNTDSSTCFIDGFVTNPLAPMRKRDSAIWDIAEAVIQEANKSGYKRCVLVTRNSAIMKRAQILGFNFSDARLMYTDFGG